MPVHAPLISFAAALAAADPTVSHFTGTDAQARPPLLRLDGDGNWTQTSTGTALLQYVEALQASKQAAAETAAVADELRRYQKFAPPGRPPLLIVQLRQQQARAKQAALVAGQALSQASATLLRELKLHAPTRQAPAPWLANWLNAHLPRE